MRLIPAVIIATGSLLFLKVVGLSTGEPFKPGPREARAQAEASVLPSDDELDLAPLTTSSAPAKKDEKKKDQVAEAPKVVEPAPPPTVSPTERAILERLQERRREIESRLKDLEMRENLIKAAEKRLEGRASELKELEAKINSTVQNRDEEEAKRMRGVVSMYETMRAKDAARIFDELDLTTLMTVATAMKPAKLADVIAQMTPATAKRLTTELARKPNNDVAANASGDLPKIEGKPVR